MSAPIDLAKAKKERARGKPGGIQRSNDPVERRLQEISEEFALVLLGGKARILRETHNFQRRRVVEFMGTGDFRDWLSEERVFDDETRRMVGIGDVWLKSPLRRKFSGVEFAPEGIPDEVCGNRFFNLWRGFSVEAAPPYPDLADHLKHIPTFADHILTNVARGNRDIAAWVWGWFADLIQHPERKVGTSLVLRGHQGTGKSKPGEIVGRLLGDHYVKIAKSKHLTGQFNSHMFNCLLLQADEGFWAGDKEAEGVLKDLVTGDVHMLEKKGIDGVQVRNLVRLYVSSNNTWVVPAAFEERRFCVLDVGDGRIQDNDYFARMDAEMEAGGLGHLLAYLQRIDLSQVNLRKIPMTEALWEQKVATMPLLNHWWLGKLREGRLLPYGDDWAGDVPTGILYGDYVRYCDRTSRERKLPLEAWAVQLRGLLPRRFTDGQKVRVPDFENGAWLVDVAGSKAWKRVNGWKNFPSLGECRNHFATIAHWTFAWGDETEGGGDVAPSPAGGEKPASGDDGGCFDLMD